MLIDNINLTFYEFRQAKISSFRLYHLEGLAAYFLRTYCRSSFLFSIVSSIQSGRGLPIPFSHFFPRRLLKFFDWSSNAKFRAWTTSLYFLIQKRRPPRVSSYTLKFCPPILQNRPSHNNYNSQVQLSPF